MDPLLEDDVDKEAHVAVEEEKVEVPEQLGALISEQFAERNDPNSLVQFGAGDEADAEERQRQFHIIMEESELKLKENKVLESYLQRKVASSEPLQQQDKKKGHKDRKNQLKELTQYQKYEIVLQELDYLNSQVADLEKANQEEIALLEAKIAGTRVTIEEMKHEAFDFNRVVVEPAQQEQMAQIEASLGSQEKKRAMTLQPLQVDQDLVLRYYQQKLIQKNTLLEKLRRNIAALQTQKARLETQKQTKEDQGETLHSIDYHQLQIKNKQFNQKIAERSKELLKLKTTAGHTVQKLDSAKRSLSALLKETKELQLAIDDKKSTMKRLAVELVAVQKEVQGLQRNTHRKHHLETDNPQMPQIKDYIDQKAEMYDLQQAIKNWQRKLEIAEMGASRARKELVAMGYNPADIDGAAEEKEGRQPVESITKTMLASAGGDRSEAASALSGGGNAPSRPQSHGPPLKGFSGDIEYHRGRARGQLFRHGDSSPHSASSRGFSRTGGTPSATVSAFNSLSASQHMSPTFNESMRLTTDFVLSPTSKLSASRKPANKPPSGSASGAKMGSSSLSLPPLS